jgi:hypothetical protein
VWILRTECIEKRHLRSHVRDVDSAIAEQDFSSVYELKVQLFIVLYTLRSLDLWNKAGSWSGIGNISKMGGKYLLLFFVDMSFIIITQYSRRMGSSA